MYIPTTKIRHLQSQVAAATCGGQISEVYKFKIKCSIKNQKYTLVVIPYSDQSLAAILYGE
jgi:hypothetical protein